ncbi:MAG: glutamate racemase [Salibacteraceae bacterium]
MTAGFFLMSASAPIGIFDSGIGGLTVAKAVKELLPNEQIIYFGDTLHLPYGEKSASSIRRYVAEISAFLKSKNCKAVLIACNSASSVALDVTRDTLDNETIVLNVIDPLIDYVKNNFKNNTVGVIGTKATINSNVYQDKLKEHCQVKALSTQLLAPMIEEGFINNRISSTIIEEYLNNPILEGIKALLLGCTHYPMIHNEIDRIYENSVTVLDSNTWIALELKKQLAMVDKLADKQEKLDEFYVSDKTDSFERSTRFFFGQAVKLKEVKLT